MFHFCLDNFSLIPLADGGGSILQRIASDFHVNWPLLTAQMVNFGIVAYVLYRFAFKPLMGTLDRRREKIAEGLQYTEEMKCQLQQTEAARVKTLREATQRAEKILGDAKTEVEIYEQKQRHELKIQLDLARSKAEEALAEDRVAMEKSLRENLKNEAVRMATKMLSVSLPEEMRRAATVNLTKKFEAEV